MARRKSWTALATTSLPKANMRRDSASRARPRRTITIVFACVCLLAVALILLARIEYASPGQYLLSNHQSEHNGGPSIQGEHGVDRFQLHPRDHIYRPADTLVYRLNITCGERRPDGVLKQVYLVNGAFPGPTIEARSGDRLMIEVTNGLWGDESLSLHWHGLSMRGYNDQDGAAGVTQKPIAPGHMYIYNFTIETQQHGTFWWHAHSAVQRADGLFGGLVVHEPAGAGQTPSALESVNEHLLLVQDFYHRSAEEALDFYMHLGSFGNEPVPDSILLNGIGAFNCADAVPARPLDCQQRGIESLPLLKMDRSKRNLLRVVNVGAYAGIGLSVEGSQLAPVAVDGGNAVSAEPATSVSTLYPGERVDLVVEPDATQEACQSLNISLDTTMFKYANPALTQTHMYKVEWSGNMGENVVDVPRADATLDLQALKPDESAFDALPDEADQVFVLYAITQKLARLENVPHGFINNTYWRPQSSPAAPLIALSPEHWDKHQLVPHIPYRPESPLWVDIVLNNLDEEGHPFHLHGSDFWVLSTYSSTFNWGSYNPFENIPPPGGPYDLKHAAKKDTVLVPRRGYAVLRIRADNPGIWMFHCHVLWHLASGMAMAFEVS